MAPRVNYMARWRAFSGKETLPGVETSQENSKGLGLAQVVDWVNRQLVELRPVNYKVTRLTASVYFQKQPKSERWTQTLREYYPHTFEQFLKLLQKKKEERDTAKKGAVKEIWVDFDLFVQPDDPQVRRGEGNVFGRNPTERQLLQLPTTQAELLATEGEITEVITHWKCQIQGCSNHPLTCWVALRDGEDLPGRVENHYKVTKGVLDIWNREIRRGMSQVDDPSENIRTLLRQERERRRAVKREELSPVLNEVNATLTELARLYAAKAQAELAASAPRVYVPFGGTHVAFRVSQTFFQWWYDHEDDLFRKEDIGKVGRRAVDGKYSIEDLRNPGKMSVHIWKREFECPVRQLLRMREMIEIFVKDPNWEGYIDNVKGWDRAVFEPEILQILAQEAEELLEL
jgi:hypothetical protein